MDSIFRTSHIEDATKDLIETKPNVKSPQESTKKIGIFRNIS